jgi:hypothetical protein
MLIIMSAAFIDAELQSEFGHLPPSFLPLGNKRLYSRQSLCRREGESVFLTLPKSYEVDGHDQVELDRLSINVLKIHDGISLGASLVQTLILAQPGEGESVQVLFGDTLINEFSVKSNCIGIAEIKDDYGWAPLSDVVDDVANFEVEDNGIQIFAGFLSITDHKELLYSLVHGNFDFITSLKNFVKNNQCSFEKNDGWLDFGHVNTYYSSRAKYTTQRAFNDLVITPTLVTKSSSQMYKMKGEANWFKSIPAELKIYTPQYLGEFFVNEKQGYYLEYLYNTPLNELFVFSKISDKTWRKILNSCFNFLEACHKVSGDVSSEPYLLSELLVTKTNQRLIEYFGEEDKLGQTWYFNGRNGVSINTIIKYIEQFTPHSTSSSVMHGDFCFSNIIYDFKTSRIKVIDPRGIDIKKESTIFGSIFYDLAKLSHSIIGLYDRILSGAFELNINNDKITFEILSSDNKVELQNWFFEQCESKFGFSKEASLSMQIHLFLSMLPLHSDNAQRQKALFSNVFRLYYELKES